MDATCADIRSALATAASASEPQAGPFVLGPGALVRDIVLHVPGASRAMERFRIDYCCGGQRSLEAVCRESRVTLDAVLGAIEEERAKGGASDAELLVIPLGHLIEHIVGEHHARTRAEALRIPALARRAVDASAGDTKAITAVSAEVERLFVSLMAHLAEEESVLFPYVVALEEAGATGGPPPVAIFESVRDEVRELERDHEHGEAHLLELRRLASDYAVDPSTAPPVRELFAALEAYEKDLQRHMHLESNVLFPRAGWLEAKLRGTRRR